MINFIINSHDLPIEYINDFNGLFLLFYVLGRQSARQAINLFYLTKAVELDPALPRTPVHSNGIVLEIPANNLWL